MKTKRATSGLGNANVVRRKTSKIVRGTWQARRLSFFQKNVRYAASAKATRTAMDVTQAEIAEEFGRSQGTVCNWESGKYSWPGGQAELDQYLFVIRKISRGWR